MTNNILTNQDYIKILQSKLNTKDFLFISAKWTPLSDDIEGFMGDHFILKLKYNTKNKENTANFFIKTKPLKTEIQREMVSSFLSYEKEIFLFNNLFKEFGKVGYDTNFAANNFYCKDNDTLVMENLQEKGFQIFKRNESFDLAHCKVALKALATYHGNSISYEELQSKEMGKTFKVSDGRSDIFKESFFMPGDKEGLGYKFIDSSINCYLKLLKVIPESNEWKTSLERRLKSFDPSQIFCQPLPFRKTCCHGDLWSNNMLFSYKNDNPIDCRLCDFQLLRHHHPAFDVLLMIYENTRRDFRSKYMKMLLDYYYETFEEIVKKNGFEAECLLPKSDFMKSAEFLKSVALFQASATRTMVLIPKTILNSAVNSGGDDLRNIVFSNERGDLVLNGVENDELFRNIMFDDVYDLNEHI